MHSYGKKYYFKGGPIYDDVWDIPTLSATSAERLGYPTQKPLALLERIIRASSNPGDIVLDAFCGCGTALVAAQQLGRRWVGIDISPTSVSVMGKRLEDNCGMKLAPPTMSAEEVAGSWNSRGAAATVPPESGQAENDGRGAAATQSYYRFSNLPRSAEQLRRLPGFEFENWAVLQLGEVLRSHGHSVFAQTNRSKVGDMGLDGKIYLADKVSLPHKGGETLFGERQSYLPIQVKNTDKVGRPEIDKFESALRRDGRNAGFFIGWAFTSDADREITRLKRLSSSERLMIIPVPVEHLIAENFDSELMYLAQRPESR
jgi:hypothetical protein